MKMIKKREFDMKKRLSVLTAVMLVIFAISASASYAEGKDNLGTKIVGFWKKLLEYPARVLEESASVVVGTAKNGITVVTDGVKRAAEVATGDLSKTKELITEPITGIAATAVEATEGIISIPSEAAKEDTEVAAANTE
jgi:hypothetical protein